MGGSLSSHSLALAFFTRVVVLSPYSSRLSYARILVSGKTILVRFPDPLVSLNWGASVRTREIFETSVSVFTLYFHLFKTDSFTETILGLISS